MADIKLMINIPEETYRRIQTLARDDYFEHDICGCSMQRIANGTPLSGKLTDTSKFIDSLKGIERLHTDDELRSSILEALYANTLEVEAPEMEKLQKIEQIIKDHDNDRMPEDYFYIDKIREVLNDGKN